MTIVVTLSPELEALLRDKAAQRGQDINIVASELLASALGWDQQDAEEAISGIQQGLNDFEAGQFRSFQDFAAEQRNKYNLPANS
jgi:predicted transcriptional regulator